MVVDDVEMNREFVEIALGREGHAVTTFSSGQAAIDALIDGDIFDLILMDVQMPVMDGLTATRAIRNLLAPANATPIIGLTANALPEQVAACRAAGMDDHIAKPVDLNALVERVAAVSARRDADLDRPEPAETTGPEDAMTGLSRRYADHLKTLPAEIDSLRELPFEDRATALATLAHGVAGTAGSLGFSSLSAAAFELEHCAKQVVSGEIEPMALEPAIRLFLEILDAVEASQ